MNDAERSGRVLLLIHADVVDVEGLRKLLGVRWSAGVEATADGEVVDLEFRRAWTVCDLISDDLSSTPQK